MAGCSSMCYPCVCWFLSCAWIRMLIPSVHMQGTEVSQAYAHAPMCGLRWGGAFAGMYLSLNPRMTFWRRMTLSVMALSRSTSSSMSWWSWRAELVSSVLPSSPVLGLELPQVGSLFFHSESRPRAQLGRPGSQPCSRGSLSQPPVQREVTGCFPEAWVGQRSRRSLI